MDRLMPWARADDGTGADPSNAAAADDFRLGGNSTTVMSDYHICRYDALLGVLVCVGDDAKVLVLGRDTTRELLPIRKGTHWLDLFVYSGTTTFLVLAPEVLLCMDYSVQRDDSFLAYSGAANTQFTCLYVPQGLTCGAVGRKDGRVGYFRLEPAASGNPQDRPRIAWTTTEVDVLGLCHAFCKGVAVDTSAESSGKFFSIGSVLSIDSYPENPDAYIAVVAGVPGVCKWYLEENRLSCFFDARSIAGQADSMLAACKVTPGGVYVAATTMHSSKVLLWNEAKKKRDKSCELYWVVDLAAGITGDARFLSSSPSSAAAGFVDESFWYNEYRVGIHMARTAVRESSHAATNDKHSQMYMLVHGQRDILEVVIRIDDKKITRMEQIIAHLNAYTAKAGVDVVVQSRAAAGKAATAGTDGTNSNSSFGRSAADDYFKVFHVEPCVLSNYWTSGLTDVDLEALFITSAGGLRPILAKRNRQTGGIESITELRELSAKIAWFPRAVLMRLPEPQIRALAAQVELTPATSTWEKLLRGGDPLLAHALPSSPRRAADGGAAADHLWPQSVVVTVADAGQAMFLSPRSNEAFAVNPRAVQNCSPWTTSVALGLDPSATLVLEAVLPSLDAAFLPSEVVLRASVTDSLLTVMKTDIRRDTCRLALMLDRAALQLEPVLAEAARGPMVTRAALVDARLEPSRVTSRMTIAKDGKCMLLLLEDSSVALVDLSGAKNEDGQPHMVLVPAGLLPVGARIVSLDAFWAPAPSTIGGSSADFLCLACLFGEGKGFLLWSLSSMRMIAYTHPAYAAAATQLCVAAAAMAPQPNLSGKVRSFEVRLPRADSGGVGGADMAPAAEYGEIVCQDALGAAVFSVAVGFGMAPGPGGGSGGGGWCVRPILPGTTAEDSKEPWRSLGGAEALPNGFAVTFVINGSSLDWSAGSLSGGAGAVTQDSQTLNCTISNVKAAWSLGSAELAYDTAEGEMRSYVLNASTGSGAFSGESPSIAFISAREINLVDIGPFIRAATTSGGGAAEVSVVPSVCRLDPARRWEHISMYRGRGAILVVTRDANGWRWVNILHNRTAKPRMPPYATLDFAGEEHVQVLSLEIENILHLYLLGESNGTIGHLFIEANLGSCKESGIIARRCFTGAAYQPTPCTFRGYGRFLPPAPTLKQETGFFKRLMTLPWSDVALKLESETLRATRPGPEAPVGSPLPPPPSTQTQTQTPQQQQRQHADPVRGTPPQQSPTTPSQATKERQELLGSSARPAAQATTPTAAAPGAAALAPAAAAAAVPGGRYAQLKAIAESQNVSLTEARRMMSENVRKVQERGEKLAQVQNKSEELAQQATSFEQLCRQLKEKQRSSWL